MGRKKKRDTDIYDRVASNIKKYRIKSGLTQQDLANRTGYTHEYIRRIESPNRRSGFTIESVHIIAKGLGIPIALLFEIKKESDE